MGGLVSTGGESEAVLKHIMVIPTNDRGQEEGIGRCEQGQRNPVGEERVSPLSSVGESQDGEEHG